jgi:hypothetical protein
MHAASTCSSTAGYGCRHCGVSAVLYSLRPYVANQKHVTLHHVPDGVTKGKIRDSAHCAVICATCHRCGSGSLSGLTPLVFTWYCPVLETTCWKSAQQVRVRLPLTGSRRMYRAIWSSCSDKVRSPRSEVSQPRAHRSRYPFLSQAPNPGCGDSVYLSPSEVRTPS